MNRNHIIDRYQDCLQRITKLNEQDAEEELMEATQERILLYQEYQAWLPCVPLSRCPFTQVVLTHSFDGEGLDGMWWSYFEPIRAAQEELPPTYFSLQGAMRLQPTVEKAPFLVQLGPGVPYIIPRLLEHAHMRAVVSSLPVGSHTAYLISYFGQPLPAIPRPNDWGIDHSERVNDRGESKWQQRNEPPASFVYELAPWIESGKLLWIAPGDKELRLQASLAGCPYVGLAGTREIQRVQYGKVWTAAV